MKIFLLCAIALNWIMSMLLAFIAGILYNELMSNIARVNSEINAWGQSIKSMTSAHRPKGEA